MITDVTLLSTFDTGPVRDRLLAAIGPKATVRVITSREGLADAQFGPGSLLLCFCADVIVPGRILEQLAGRAYNFHPGSPEFPGRVPSDMAVYQGAREFGATAHLMTRNVDEGPIVGVKRFLAPQGCTSSELNALSVRANLRLFQSLVPLLLKGEPLPILQNVRWGSIKSSKRNRLEGRYLSELLSEDEFLRRIRSFGDKSQSFTTVIHGVPFSMTMASAGPQLPTAEDRLFTEDAYEGLLRRIKDLGYAFTGYSAAEASDGRRLILHHNVRFSVHRAKRVATIEAGLGLSASYFFSISSSYYSLLEESVARLVKDIIELGHEVGLLVPQAIARTPPDEQTLHLIAQDCALLNERTGSLVNYVSEEGGAIATIAGGKIALRVHFDETYKGENSWNTASDHSGYWERLSADDLIEQGYPRVRIIADPAWWTPTPLSPRERIARCILGRARAAWLALGEDAIHFGKEKPRVASTIPSVSPPSR